MRELVQSVSLLLYLLPLRPLVPLWLVWLLFALVACCLLLVAAWSYACEVRLTQTATPPPPPPRYVRRCWCRHWYCEPKEPADHAGSGCPKWQL